VLGGGHLQDDHDRGRHEVRVRCRARLRLPGSARVRRSDGRVRFHYGRLQRVRLSCGRHHGLGTYRLHWPCHVRSVKRRMQRRVRPGREALFGGGRCARVQRRRHLGTGEVLQHGRRVGAWLPGEGDRQVARRPVRRRSVRKPHVPFG
jgi:hypothetical protein